MLGKTNVKKWKTFGTRTIQEPYTVTETYTDYETYTYYETVTTPVYANGNISYTTNAGSYGYNGTLYNNTDTVIEANMGGSGWVTVSPGRSMNFGGQNTNGAVKMNGVQIWSGGINPNWTTTIWSGNPKIQIGTTTTQVPRQGTRPVTKTRTVTKYRDKVITTETWHPWWVKRLP